MPFPLSFHSLPPLLLIFVSFNPSKSGILKLTAKFIFTSLSTTTFSPLWKYSANLSVITIDHSHLLRSPSLFAHPWKMTAHIPWWTHRQCVGLAFRRSRVLVQLPAASLVICGPNLHRASGAQGLLPYEGRRVTASQLDLPSLTPLSAADCNCMLPMGYFSSPWQLIVCIIDRTNSGGRFSTDRLLHGQRRLYKKTFQIWRTVCPYTTRVWRTQWYYSPQLCSMRVPAIWQGK